jgi:integrase
MKQMVPILIKGRAKPWKVDLSAKFSESGQRERHFFETRKLAEGFIDKQRIRIKNTGTQVSLLSPAQREAATKAFELLGDNNPMTLVDVVRDWIKKRDEDSKSVTLGEAWDAFASDRADKSTHYHRQLRSARNRFQALENIKVSVITRREIESSITDHPPTAFNGYLRVVRAVLNFSVNQGWAKENPSARIAFRSLPKNEVQILSNWNVGRLLVACKKYSPQDMAYIAIGLFAGVRPEELLRLEWEMVRLEEKHILMPASITKTGRKRVVDIEPALDAWLSLQLRNGTPPVGPIVEKSNLRNRLRNLRGKARIAEWPQDGMRHTYASNHLAFHESLDRLLLNMGHSDPKMLWRHYHKAVLKKDATKFWNLYPKPKPPKTKPVNRKKRVPAPARVHKKR